MGNVMDLKLMVPREDMGKILAARFRKAPEKLYSEIIDLLLNRNDEEDSLTTKKVRTMVRTFLFHITARWSPAARPSWPGASAR